MPILRPEDATKEVRVVYEDFHRRMSFPSPPNFIMTQGHSEAVARGTWDVVRSVLVLGEIPRWIKEMMFVAISNDRNCRYCAAAHVACCRMLGVSQSLLDALATNIEGIADNRARALVLFGLRCSRAPQAVNENDYRELRNQGLKQSEIMEAIAMSAFAVYANIIADATGMDPDEMFGTI